jgi:hypothetical protein
MAHITKDEGLSQGGYHTSRASKHLAAIKVTAMIIFFHLLVRPGTLHSIPAVKESATSSQPYYAENSGRGVKVKERSSIILADVLVWIPSSCSSSSV